MKLFGRMMVLVSMLALIVSAVAFAGDDELPGDCDDCSCEVADCCGDCHSDDCTCDCDGLHDCDGHHDIDGHHDCDSHLDSDMDRGHCHGHGDFDGDEDTGGHCGGCH